MTKKTPAPRIYTNIPVSDVIKQRIALSEAPFTSTDNISRFIKDEEMPALQRELQTKIEAVLSTLCIDVENDHNTKDTAKRVAKMFLNEMFAGRYTRQPEITVFPNARALDELYTVGPISVRSTCSHHLVPIMGKLWIGVHPSDVVMGLSKFHRISNWIMARPQIQEEATQLLADTIEELISPKGLGIVFTAQHMCCSMRGVQDPDTWMTTSVVRGTLREHPTLKEEFMSLIKLNH